MSKYIITITYLLLAMIFGVVYLFGGNHIEHLVIWGVFMILGYLEFLEIRIKNIEKRLNNL